MSVKAIRRANLRQLAKEVGGISRLANRLDKNQSHLSHLIGKRPIKDVGDKFAAEVERAFDKPPGWLDRICSLEFEEEVSLSLGDSDIPGILCRQIPLISWTDIGGYLGVEQALPREVERVVTSIPLSPLGFALRVQGDSMESGKGMSFPEGSVIIVDPNQQLKSDDFVVVQIQPDRGATLKQFMISDGKNYLKPLNLRYPSLNFTPHTRIWGVVKQLLIDF